MSWCGGRRRASAGPGRPPGRGTPAASLSMAAPWRADLGATKPGNSEGFSSPDFDSVTVRQLAQLGEHAGALGPAAVHQHQRDVLDGRRGVAEQARRPTPRGGPRGRGRPRSGWLENSDGADISPSEASVRSEPRVSVTSASASWARTAVADRGDGALVEELLLAGHQGDPAEDAGGARQDLPWCAACHSPPTSPEVAGLPPRWQVLTEVEWGSVGGGGRQLPVVDHDQGVAVEVGAQHLGPGGLERRAASRAPGGRSRCPPPR